MGKLEELNKKLYSLAFPGRKRLQKLPPSPQEGAGSRAWTFGPKELQEQKHAKRRRSYAMMLFGFLVGLILLGILAYWALQSGFLLNFLGSAEVELSIIAPAEIVAGDRITYSIAYINKSAYTLKNVELLFEYPKGSDILPLSSEEEPLQSLRVRVPVNDIPPKTEGTVDFAARLFGQEGERPFARVVFRYVPENIASRFEIKKEHELTIVRVPLIVSMRGAEKVLTGESREYTIEYASNASAQFRDVALRLIVPEGFQAQEFGTDPIYKGDREFVWDVGSITPGSSGSIRIQGVLSGAPLEPKSFQYGIGIYNKETKAWMPYVERFAVSEIIEPPLFIQATVAQKRDLTMGLGSNAQAELTYRNNSNVPLRNLIITVTLEGPYDPVSLRAPTGAVIGSNTIQWKVATDPALGVLEIGETRTLPFSFNAHRPNRVGAIKNADIVVTAHITAEKDESVDFTPVGSDMLRIPIKAVPYFSSKALYSGTIIPNTGPIPPKVGQETTYVVIWEVGSFGGDLTDARVRASLPPYVSWKGNFIPSNAAIAYRPATNEIVWNMGTVRSGDLDAGSQKVSFQIGLTPSPSHINFGPDLVTGIALTAVDMFTNTDIELSVRSLTSDIRDDFGVPQNSGRVVE